MVIIAGVRFTDASEKKARGGTMITLLTGLMLAVAVFTIVTLAGALIWFWKNREHLPRWRHFQENNFQQKDYYLHHQAEYRKSESHQYSEKVDRAA